jgi:hypothetical protein
MTGPLVGVTVLQPASGTVVLPGQSMTCSGRAATAGLCMVLAGLPVPNLNSAAPG